MLPMILEIDIEKAVPAGNDLVNAKETRIELVSLILENL